jgi:predicted enzyme related to lactoylglutathione lyase
MTTGTRTIGEFCWINILTPKPPESRAFFAAVLGWTYAELPGVGHIIRVGGRDMGGLFDVVSPRTPDGTPPIVGVMVKVSDADASRDRVVELGGKADPAFDIGDAGRMAVCFDPSGAELDVWQPKSMHGTDADSALPGAPVWFELMTHDLDRAVEFYSRLFGWTARSMPPPTPDMRYTVFELSGKPVAGAMQITPRMGNVRSRWRTYFTVSDIEIAMRRATELGARVDMAVRDVPGGRIAGLSSPHGVEFCLSERAS